MNKKPENLIMRSNSPLELVKLKKKYIYIYYKAN